MKTLDAIKEWMNLTDQQIKALEDMDDSVIKLVDSQKKMIDLQFQMINILSKRIDNLSEKVDSHICIATEKKED